MTNIKKYLALAFATLLTCSFAQAQNRVVLGDAVRVVMDGGVFIVIDNSNTNAITKVGSSDGIIISDDEDNQVLWEIGTATGAYVVPFGSSAALGFEEIPVTVTITGAGTGTGDVRFSTWEATGGASASNSPWPSNVTHLNDAATGTTNNNSYCADRWWWIDANGYTARPTANLTLTYVRDADEIGGSNSLTEGNLQAQRFNDGTGNWEVAPNMMGPISGSLSIGTTTGTVSGISAPSAEFFSSWILSDNTNALPVELLYFNAVCEGARARLEWATATEINNSHFELQKSTNAQNWETFAVVEGAGNSISTIEYAAYDNTSSDQTVYYRIVQTDFDGTSEAFDPMSLSPCSSDLFDVVLFNNGEGHIGLGVNSTFDEDVVISVTDMNGRVIISEETAIQEGFNTFELSSNNISHGLYVVTIRGEKNNWSDKILLR